jgi:hypothetical protein
MLGGIDMSRTMKIPECFGETDDCFGCPLADECEELAKEQEDDEE